MQEYAPNAHPNVLHAMADLPITVYLAPQESILQLITSVWTVLETVWPVPPHRFA